jgi:hypothetical protein
MKRIAFSEVAVGLLVTLAAMGAPAQSPAPASSQGSASGTSLGEYARQIKKGPGTTAKPKVFDNDNLPKEEHLSIVGKAPAAEGQNQGAAADASTNAATQSTAEAKPATEENDAAKQAAWKQWGERIKAQKDQIDLLSRELTVLQREYQIRAAAMYADVGNRLRNSGDWDKQDAQYKQQIADKEKAVDDAKQKLDDIEEEARKAGVPASMREQ